MNAADIMPLNYNAHDLELDAEAVRAVFDAMKKKQINVISTVLKKYTSHKKYKISNLKLLTYCRAGIKKKINGTDFIKFYYM